jgi:hypothetical protein
MYTHHKRIGASNNAQNKITFGGQNGANILSDSVPTRNAASAPMKYATATSAAFGKVLLNAVNGRRAALAILDIMNDRSKRDLGERSWSREDVRGEAHKPPPTTAATEF